MVNGAFAYFLNFILFVLVDPPQVDRLPPGQLSGLETSGNLLAGGSGGAGTVHQISGRVDAVVSPDQAFKVGYPMGDPKLKLKTFSPYRSRVQFASDESASGLGWH